MITAPRRPVLKSGWEMPPKPYPCAIPTAYVNQGYVFLYWPTRFGGDDRSHRIPWPYEGVENVGVPEAFMALGFEVEDLELKEST